MEAVGIKQAQLARRVGVTQGAISKIAKDNPNGSSFLHLLARELQTTPAYLTAEVDDPNQEAPAGPELTYDQLELVEYFERMTPENRATFLQMGRALAEKGTSPKNRLHSEPLAFRPGTIGETGGHE